MKNTMACITAGTVQDQLTPLLKSVKNTCFVSGYDPSNAELMGILLAKFFKWDGLAIAETAGYALEDSNFHVLNERLQLLIDEEFKPGQK